jgi:hypothetical protein
MTDELKQWEYDRGYEKGKTDVLDKIRAEIKNSSHGKWYVGRLDGKTEEVLLLDEVLEIIDEYRKEQE